jgi:hypothetical protein
MAPPAARAEGKKREQHGHVVQCLRISVFFGQWSRQDWGWRRRPKAMKVEVGAACSSSCCHTCIRHWPKAVQRREGSKAKAGISGA